jgi:hypothetical protein
MSKKIYHIIWSTFGSYPVWDNRGDWLELKATYGQLVLNEVDFELNKEFTSIYNNKPITNQQIEIDESHFEFLKDELIDLAKIDGDRIAGDLELLYVNINKTFIELIVKEKPSDLKQKLSRLKSRLATLMSFNEPEIFKGKKTWGKGIWISTINSKVTEAIEILKLPTTKPKLH